MTAKNLTITFSVTYGTEAELKKVRGRTLPIDRLKEMIHNEIDGKFEGDLPNVKNGVLKISYSKQRPQGPYKDRRPKKKRKPIGEIR